MLNYFSTNLIFTSSLAYICTVSILSTANIASLAFTFMPKGLKSYLIIHWIHI